MYLFGISGMRGGGARRVRLSQLKIRVGSAVDSVFSKSTDESRGAELKLSIISGCCHSDPAWSGKVDDLNQLVV